MEEVEYRVRVTLGPRTRRRDAVDRRVLVDGKETQILLRQLDWSKPQWSVFRVERNSRTGGVTEERLGIARNLAEAKMWAIELALEESVSAAAEERGQRAGAKQAADLVLRMLGVSKPDWTAVWDALTARSKGKKLGRDYGAS